jgi:uncharacterized protein
MDHFANWIEIPVSNMNRAAAFYATLLEVNIHAVKMGDNEYGIFGVKDRHNTGSLVCGQGYVPSKEGVIVYLNGGSDLSKLLSKVEKSGGKILLNKTFLGEQAGYIAYLLDSEGNKIGLHSMA